MLLFKFREKKNEKIKEFSNCVVFRIFMLGFKFLKI